MAKESAGQTSGGSRRSRRWGEKSKFILQYPFDVPARQIVEEAKKHGLSITTQYVYIIRRNAKQKGVVPAGSAARSQARRGRPAVGPSGAERRFRELALEIGLGRAEELLKDLRERVDRLISTL